jgi:hypothetical protein
VTADDVGHVLARADRNNWAPRVGVAWDVAGDGQTVVRGGYGVAYQRVADLASSVSYQNPPYFAVSEAFDVPLGAVPAGGAPQLRAVDERLRNPYTHFWNLSVERQLGDAVVSVDYAGSKGVGLASVDDVNRLPARLNPRYGDIWQLRNSGSSVANGVSLGVESRRLDPFGLQLSARYTWSHAIDNVSSDGSIFGFSPGLLDPFDPRLDRGDADADVRHRFAARGVWDMPFGGDQEGWRKRLLGGWAVSWVFDARTGTPFTVYDCTNAVANCARLVEVAPVDRNGTGDPAASALAADLATGDRYVFVDLAGQLPGRGLYAGSGPFPSGMTARNAFRAPGTWNLDGAVARTIAFNERVSLELRVEAFDVFNHANLFVSRGEADLSQSVYVPAFYDGRRQVQFGAKLTF